MIITLLRSYFPSGVNGELWHNDALLSYCIELPWRDNMRSISCIPEGRYKLVKRYSTKFKNHLHVLDVRDRSFILLHPANVALRDLRGCISPVLQLTGVGSGGQSRVAMQRLLDLVEAPISVGVGVDVWLVVKEKV